jgi:hypothetical protein
MKLFEKRTLQIVVVAAAVAVLGLLTPRAAHAVAAALVQITNTTANPGVTQDATLAASQIVTLVFPGVADLETGSVTMVQYIPGSGKSASNYVVPGGQHLVITGLDVQIYTGGGTLTLGPGGIESMNLQSAAGTQQFQFPTGIVFPSGSNVVMSMNSGSVYVTARGYLTAD